MKENARRSAKLKKLFSVCLAFFALNVFPLHKIYAVVKENGVSKAIEEENNSKKIEVYRVLIENKKDGEIKASSDKGQTWTLLGHVLMPTQITNHNGYEASRYAAIGHVAATAVNAIHIKTDMNEKEDVGVIFSLLPKEMLKPPKTYHSFLSPDSSIYTDIKAGWGIFGGGYAPFVGNPVYTMENGELKPLPQGYVPKENDSLVIVVEQPERMPSELIFENRFGGFITLKYPDGEEKIIGEVLKPLAGVGRFDGTYWTFKGRVRANHNGVIDISTSPYGQIGGFQIIPANHGMAKSLPNARLLTQWMVVGPVSALDKDFAGTAPLFSNYIKPDYSPEDLYAENGIERMLSHYLVQVKISGSDEWKFMPSVTGRVDDGMKDITAIRILFPVRETSP